MSLTMKQLKGEIDVLAECIKSIFDKIDGMSSTNTVINNAVSNGCSEELDAIAVHIPRPLLKEMVKIFEANSHKDINSISDFQVLMEMQVEFGKLSIELAKRSSNKNEGCNINDMRGYLIDLMNYSVILWRKLDSIDDGWLED